jgi:hypothetical protein
LVEPQESNPSSEVVQDPGVTPMVKIPAIKIISSTSALHATRAVTKAPLVGSHVHHSVRLSEKSQGYKTDSCNPSKACICCSTNPPCLVSMTTNIPKSSVFRFKNYWLLHEEFLPVMQHGWSIYSQPHDKAKKLMAKLKKLMLLCKHFKSGKEH